MHVLKGINCTNNRTSTSIRWSFLIFHFALDVWIALCSSLVFSLIMVKPSKTSKCPRRKVLESALGFGPPGSALATT